MSKKWILLYETAEGGLPIARQQFAAHEKAASHPPLLTCAAELPGISRRQRRAFPLRRSPP